MSKILETKRTGVRYDRRRKIMFEQYASPEWERVLRLHGWKQSQCDGSWYRNRKNGVKEFRGLAYLPKYRREREDCIE